MIYPSIILYILNKIYVDKHREESKFVRDLFSCIFENIKSSFKDIDIQLSRYRIFVYDFEIAFECNSVELNIVCRTQNISPRYNTQIKYNLLKNKIQIWNGFSIDNLNNEYSFIEALEYIVNYIKEKTQ